MQEVEAVQETLRRGTMSAEHVVGQAKVWWVGRQRGGLGWRGCHLPMMRGVKWVLDPVGIMIIYLIYAVLKK